MKIRQVASLARFTAATLTYPRDTVLTIDGKRVNRFKFLASSLRIIRCAQKI